MQNYKYEICNPETGFKKKFKTLKQIAVHIGIHPYDSRLNSRPCKIRNYEVYDIEPKVSYRKRK